MACSSRDTIEQSEGSSEGTNDGTRLIGFWTRGATPQAATTLARSGRETAGSPSNSDAAQGQIMTELGQSTSGRPCAPADVSAALFHEEADTLDMEHVVLVDDPYLDVPMVLGPFSGPVNAATFAHQYREDLQYEGCEFPARVTVVPLRHPDGSAQQQRSARH